jgi:hypothetical protein
LIFPVYHTFAAFTYRKMMKSQNIEELAKFKYTLMYGDYADSHIIRYMFIGPFALRRVLNAVVILMMTDSPLASLVLLLLINMAALVHVIIARPYKDSLLNLHCIINDLGVVIVIGEFFLLLDAYVTDKTFYFYGRLLIATIAIIIWLNFVLFIVSYILGILAFMRRCPICSCCRRKAIKEKETLFYD